MFDANDYNDEATVDFMDNFSKGKSRQLDTITTYSGMYGIDNYLIWNIHKNLPSYDFSTMALDLSLYMYKSTDIVYFQDFYRIQDIRYNPNKSQYTVYAISETTVRLHTKLIEFGVTSLSYKENRTAKQLLIELIEDKNIFYLRFHDDSLSTKTMIDYQYRYFDIDPEWTVLDLIEHIANTNKYEWCVKTFVDAATNIPYFFLHIGHELKADENMNATKKFNIEDDNISDSIYTKKITTNGSPMEPLAQWEGNLRCLWSKHYVGKGGGVSKGCFTPVGMGHFDKSAYLKTLEGDIERHIGYSMLNRRNVRVPSIGIGNIIKDEGYYEFIDQVSIQKNPDTYSITEPHDILINRGEDIPVQHQLEQVNRSTPYLDHNAGLFFPSAKLNEGEPPPNSLIFNVDGKRESAVVGPFVYGDGRQDEDGNLKLRIPTKDKEDFRLQLPNGWCLYVKGNGDTYLNIRDVDPNLKIDDIPETDLNQLEGLYIKTAGEDGKSELMIGIDEFNFITMRNKEDVNYYFTDGVMYIKGNKEIFLQVDATDFIRILPDDTGAKKLTISTNINGILIQSLDGGTIDINTSGVVNVGASASAVNLAGGANTLSHGTHTHTVGNLGITVPPSSDNTIKTKAD